MSKALSVSGSTTLSRATLPALPLSVRVPQYDAHRLSAGIVHVGLGNFHRAHQAWYLHRLMNEGKALDWAIVGASVREQDTLVREKLLAQDCLTTLIELSPDTTQAEVVGSMLGYVPIEENNSALIAQMCLEHIRIVSQL